MSCWSQVHITRFTSEGLLSWTNQICNPQSIYEVAWTPRLGAEWESLMLVTNQTSVSVGPVDAKAGPKFFRVTWVDGIPDYFGYAYYENISGTPTLVVSGEIILWFDEGGDAPLGYHIFTGTGVSTTHPLGIGFIPSCAWDQDTLRLQLNQVFDGDSYRVEGQLTRGERDGMCFYRHYEGTVEVWRCTIEGCEPGYVPSGWFVADRIGGIFSEP